MKVYGGHLDGRHRYIVAAKSMKKAWEALNAAGMGISYRYCLEYMTDTGNQLELDVALAKPGVVFRSKDKFDKEFEEYNYK